MVSSHASLRISVALRIFVTALVSVNLLLAVLRDILARLKNQENTTQALQAQMDNKNAEIAALQEQLKDSRAG